MIWPTTLLRNESFEVRARKRKDGVVARRFVTTTGDALTVAKSFGIGWDIYYGVATRFQKGGKKQDCFRVNTVWADLDNTDKLPDFGKLHPTVVVNTGGGFHLYWILETPIFLRTGKWKEIEAINRGLCQKFSGDKMSIDIARILRIPDFINHKYDPKRKVTASAVQD